MTSAIKYSRVSAPAYGNAQQHRVCERYDLNLGIEQPLNSLS